MRERSRPRLPNKDLEALIRTAEQRGWRVLKGSKYYKAYCPCPAKCKETIHLTPSSPNYARNKRNKMSKCPSWDQGYR